MNIAREKAVTQSPSTMNGINFSLTLFLLVLAILFLCTGLILSKIGRNTDQTSNPNVNIDRKKARTFGLINYIVGFIALAAIIIIAILSFVYKKNIDINQYIKEDKEDKNKSIIKYIFILLFLSFLLSLCIANSAFIIKTIKNLSIGKFTYGIPLLQSFYIMNLVLAVLLFIYIIYSIYRIYKLHTLEKNIEELSSRKDSISSLTVEDGDSDEDGDSLEESEEQAPLIPNKRRPSRFEYQTIS